MHHITFDPLFCQNYYHFSVDRLETDRFHNKSEIILDSNIHVWHDISILITPHPLPKDRTIQCIATQSCTINFTDSSFASHYSKLMVNIRQRAVQRKKHAGLYHNLVCKILEWEHGQIKRRNEQGEMDFLPFVIYDQSPVYLQIRC